MKEVKIPFDLTPRPHQAVLLEKMFLDKAMMILLRWHRRAGKDAICFYIVLLKAILKAGNYFYLFPTAEQGRKVMWEMKDDNGNSMLDLIPKELGAVINNQSMKITIPTTDGRTSLIRILGVDKIRKGNRGFRCDGAVFSEFSFQDPKGYQVFMPAVRGTKGWVIFQSTPQGKDHFYMLEEVAKKSLAAGEKHWYISHLQTMFPERENYSGVFTPEEIIRIQAEEGYSDAVMLREYAAVYESGVDGSVFLNQIVKARKESRIDRFMYDNRYPVFVYADLGYQDDTVLLYFQYINNNAILIDYWSGNRMEIPEIAKVAMYEKEYNYKTLILPHDATQNYGLNYTKEAMFRESLKSLGVKCTVEVAPRVRVQTAIDLVRSKFSKYCVNVPKCNEFLEKLEKYHYKYIEPKDMFDDRNAKPVHDKNSHAASALCTEAVYTNRYGDPGRRLLTKQLDLFKKSGFDFLDV